MEPEMEKLSDDELKAKTNEFRARIERRSVESLIRKRSRWCGEASKRVFGMRVTSTFAVGGMVLNDRCIAEMRTGEKVNADRNAASLPERAVGKGVHVVTVNDYLAQRDAEKTTVRLFEDSSVCPLVSTCGMPAPAVNLRCDITYGT